MKQLGFNPKARWDRHIPKTQNDDPCDTGQLNEGSGAPRTKVRGSLPEAKSITQIPIPGLKPGDFAEGIKVLAYFNAGKIYPRMFVWNNKIYKIKNITYSWQERKGYEIISRFSADTIHNLYQISFNNTSYSWKIDKIIE